MITRPSAVSNEPPTVELHSKLPRRKFLRQQLNACCVQDGDLDAFCLDWFPEIYRQFARGMTRTEKLNLLLGLAQPLDDIATALEEEWALRTQKTVIAPSVAKSPDAPRPRHGQHELEVVIEDNFHELSADKLAGWMRTIQRLARQELKVVLRNCRAGSVILTLHGDWRALMPLKKEFAAGRLRAINGYRVLDMRWLCPSTHRSRLQALRESLRIQQLRVYVAVGRLQEWLTKVAAIFKVPRWAVAVVLFFLFSGAAWAAQKVVRVIAEHLVTLAPVVDGEAPAGSTLSDRRSGSRKTHRAEKLDTGNALNDLGTPINLEVTAGITAGTPLPDARAAKREIKRGEADREEAISPKAEANSEDSVSDTEQTLSNAQTEYVNGNFSQAINVAKSVQDINPTRAWRIMGAAACSMKDVKLASEAFKHLDSLSRQYLIYTCQRQGITNTKGSQFKLN